MERFTRQFTILMMLVSCSTLQAANPPSKQTQEKPQQESTSSSSAFECGKPLGPCGSAIPSGVTCAKGAGWCQSGHFCGWEQNTGEPSRCLPLPKNCGTAGHHCCPSNTDTPHTSLEDKLKRKPFCKDGSYCFYFAPVPNLNNGDMYAGNPGARACTAVAPDCGTGQGKPCCPYLYRIQTNPELKSIGCPDKMYCNSGPYQAPPGGDYRLEPGSPPGTCEVNAPDCGKFGKSCCISTTGVTTNMKCGPQWNEPGPRGYCADPNVASGKKSGPWTVSLKELICTPCPDKVEPSTQQTNPALYASCHK